MKKCLNNPAFSGCKIAYSRMLDPRKNLEVNVTVEDLYNQWVKQQGRCALTGRRLKFGRTDYNRKHGYTTASLDRKNNNKGYVKGNIQWVHKKINLFKGDLSQRDFKRMCNQVSVSDGVQVYYEYIIK